MKTKGYVEGGYRFFFIDENMEKEISYHFHDFHKCVIVYSGDVTYTIEGKPYQLGPGSILWVPAYEMHKVSIRETAQYRRCVVYMSQEFINHLGTEVEDYFLGVIESKENAVELTRKQVSSLIELFPFDNRKKSQLYNIGGFIQFMEAYIDAISEEKSENDRSSDLPAKDLRLIDEVMMHIKSDPSRDLKIEDIAKEFFISKFYLMRKFKEMTGLTLHRYIIEERLKLATQSIKKGNSLTQTAYNAGFGNYTTFARCFKKVYHMSPRDYVKMHPIRYDSWNE